MSSTIDDLHNNTHVNSEPLPTVLYRTNTSEMFSPLPSITEEQSNQNELDVEIESNTFTFHQPIILVTPVVSENLQFEIPNEMQFSNTIYNHYTFQSFPKEVHTNEDDSNSDTDEESYMEYIRIQPSQSNTYPSLAPIRVAPVYANLEAWFPPA